MAAEFRSLVVSRHARVGVVGDPASAREAWLILHGYGMLARGILHWFRGADDGNRLLVAPEGLSRFYTVLSGGKRSVGASWVTREDLDHELEDQFAYLERAVAECIPTALPLQVHGFSQGVSAATRWTVRTARAVEGVFGWAGVVPDDVTGERLTAKLGTRPLRLLVGNDDARVTPEQVEADATRLRREGMAVEVRHFEGGHRVELGALA
jgi:predicted esterase